MRTPKPLASSVAALLAIAGLAATGLEPAAAAATPGYFSTKQLYEPQGSEYGAAPEGFAPLQTLVVGRHGARGLSGFKYDDLAAQMLGAAKGEGQLTPLGEELIPQVQAMTTANEELSGGPGQDPGYGNLTDIGRAELQDIGKRNAERNPGLMADIAAGRGAVRFSSSGEDRATDSGWNFGAGLLAQAPEVRPEVEFDDAAGHVDITPTPELLYAHKVKTLPSYGPYSAWTKSAELEAKVDAAYAKPESRAAATDLLGKIFTQPFIDALESGERSFVGSEDGDEVVDGVVDAALEFYNLYIIAPAMADEKAAPAGGWIFDRYMDEANGPVFAYLLDVEDYYEKGPAIAGRTVSFDNYAPLLQDMLDSVQKRADGGDVAADYRFGHAETIIPLAALMKLPGSERGVPADKVMSYANSDWRGASVSPMAGNIQWDSFENQDGVTLVRMLYNEKEIAFHDGCEPVSAGSTFYALGELEDCLPYGSESDHSRAHPLGGGASSVGGLGSSARWGSAAGSASAGA